MSIKVQEVCSKLVGPIHEGDQPSIIRCIALSVFDKLMLNQYVPLIYAYKSPTPSNSLLELGLRKVLSEYREWAGRFKKDDVGDRIIVLNDKGVKFIEASTDCTLDQAIPFTQSTLLSLTPSVTGVEELAIVQITRFTCDSLVVCFSLNHLVADGFFISRFLDTWGQACRGLQINPRPLHDRNIFVPRDPCRIEFNHSSIEFNKGMNKEEFLDSDNKPPYSRNDVIHHKVHFTVEFIAKLKCKVSSSAAGLNRPYSTFESLVAHLWRTVTRVRGLTEFQTTEIRISMNGRRRLKPCVPDDYLGNLVLWTYPAAEVKDILHEPLNHTADIIHEAVVKVNDDYFKSFIDFASCNVPDDEDLMPEAIEISRSSLWPNMEVDSWLGFAFNNVDFGFGKPYIFMPSFEPLEGLIFLVPSLTGDGSVDVFINLFQQHLDLFEKLCYSID